MNEPQSIKLSAAWRELKRERVAFSVLAYAGVALALCEYVILPVRFVEFFPGAMVEYAPGVLREGWDRVPAGSDAPWWGVLLPFMWWCGGLLVVWVLVPSLLTRLFGQRVRDMGLGVRGLLPKLWVYGVMLAIVLVGVWWASTRPGFTRMYPMVKPWYWKNWSWVMLLAWWGIYALQFFAVEFFFRGWLLFTLEKRFGCAAIAIMVVPYCMIHFHKPLPEALGAIVAGTVLGWMALRTRSIWGGWLVHVSVAVTMDTASLVKGDWGLPHQFWP
ncbi:MAG: CPBP family intramembrane metalloprotease [Planctomycetes bacterium]|nr:CPBP family intramembrane metalloprotease [Planctomycetota bacterium]